MHARVYCEKNLACDTVLGRLQEQFASITQVPQSHAVARVYQYARLNKKLAVFAQSVGLLLTKK